jgi:4-hydroxymandelate oxidase
VRTGFSVPPELVPSLAATGSDRPASVAEVLGLVDPTLTWGELESIAGACRVPVLVKGVMTAEDAHLAVDHGAAGVIVSNHGGRQLDGVPASIDVLPEVVDAVAGRIEVFMDGGVRRGADVVVALALGARAVLVGRPPLWGLAVGGEDGARRVLEILQAEVELALTLCGCPSPRAASPSFVQRRPN